MDATVASGTRLRLASHRSIRDQLLREQIDIVRLGYVDDNDHGFSEFLSGLSGFVRFDKTRRFLRKFRPWATSSIHFRPAPGSEPPYLVGRDAELAVANQAMTMTKAGAATRFLFNNTARLHGENDLGTRSRWTTCARSFLPFVKRSMVVCTIRSSNASRRGKWGMCLPLQTWDRARTLSTKLLSASACDPIKSVQSEISW